ncbi:hypothetical protein E3N88_44440 [Mikania micrantha]|uniref:Retrotransposon Copia-like N-terminal domain-containing protein n=1 Tax=Mikania micrantha TaxID=192012 RepID=A0A5N6LC22_9ASTR|nr:hypothetical protein E3N88_44440 [Mikania micrantha]
MSTSTSNESPIITTIPIITTPALTVVNFPSSLKLTSTNYLGWKTQVEAILHGLDLFKFIDGSHPPPQPTIAASGISSPHPDYHSWFRQDRLLFGALVGTLSSQIVPLVTNASSSFDAWKILSNTYASPSRGHIKQLQHRLKQTTKTHDQSITDYMQSIKTLVDELSILGKQLDPEDITDIILNGLDQHAYKPIITAIHARDTPILFHELHEKLINHELSLNQTSSPNPPMHQPTTAFHVAMALALADVVVPSPLPAAPIAPIGRALCVQQPNAPVLVFQLSNLTNFNKEYKANYWKLTYNTHVMRCERSNLTGSSATRLFTKNSSVRFSNHMKVVKPRKKNDALV